MTGCWAEVQSQLACGQTHHHPATIEANCHLLSAICHLPSAICHLPFSSMSVKVRKRLYFLLAAALAGVAAVASALFFSPNLLRLEDAPGKADAIVILGGETIYRPARGLELYQQGAATNVIITGEGDCESVRIVLAGKGVP